MPDLGNAYVNIIPKAPGIENNIEQVLNGGAPGAERAGTSLGKRMLGGLSALGIGAAVGSMVKSAFEAGGNLQQSFGGLETIYGEAAAQAKSFAQEAAAAGISANSYAEQAVSFGAALKAAYGGDTTAAMSAANTAILDMADNAAKMGTPLESIQAAYQGFARGQYTLLDNLKLGYGGTKTEMERLLADAQEISGIEYNIDNLGDVYDAIHVIQGELGLTGVAAKEAETTLTGSLGAVKASWENVMAALTTGQGLDTAMSHFTESVGNFAENVFLMLGQLSGQLPGLILGLAHVVIDNAPSFIASGVEMIAQLGVGLIQAIPDIVSMIPSLFYDVFTAIWEMDWASIGADIINGIISGLWSMGSALWNAMRQLAASAWQSAKQALGIGSPSKVFAQEVGRWIPAGMAEGIDDNLAPVTSATQNMANASLEAVQPAQSASSSGVVTLSDGDMARLLEALQGRVVELYLDGEQITNCVTIRQRRAARSTGGLVLT